MAAAQPPLPLLLPTDAALREYRGFVALACARTHARAHTNTYTHAALRVGGLEPRAERPAAHAEVGGEGVVDDLLASSARARSQLAAARAACRTVRDFLAEVDAALAAAARELGGAPSAPGSASGVGARASASALRSTCAELRCAGWHRLRGVRSLGPRCALSVCLEDGAGREHELAVEVGGGAPARCVLDAPGAPIATLAASGAGAGAGAGVAQSLEAALAEASARLAAHQALFAELDAIDAACVVLEPSRKPPPRAATYRRIALEKHASVMLELDAHNPRGPPTRVAFLGAEVAVAAPRAALAAACAPGSEEGRGEGRRGPRWDAGISVLANLRAVVHPLLAMLAPDSHACGTDGADGAVGGGQTVGGESGAECGICYSYHLPLDDDAGGGEDGGGGDGEGAAPDMACEGCGMPFHRRCMREWLQSDANARQSFRTLFGACPFCSAPVTLEVDA